ncbi:hypothetical protein BC792_12052 [Sphingobacterium allocomposti]|uniref:Methylamine utilisation protein MauE domain-containing protein n=1 Tax=Sphingobacterium allocomposti TaxID=415956 RepID=A0A5S5D7A9_9SPHI|nr:MauE/DoxX family redox-associated membrane protein [Sphingobacterium composti Yoo et al. 2007 non Ten et al. 2007]TYP91344.1 hypothetical protein BC792_12052 [Sphingobacterium composti Yoo et al. 2007 non Ten et al. 2007]
MKAQIRHIISHSLHIFLMLFWLYVALDKFWDLPSFHAALLRQPFPDAWADVLFWSLPMTEMGISLLFVLSRKRTAYLLSVLLMLAFTLYIGLGVAGFYPKKPCGCASVFSGLSWSSHLLVNGLLLVSSILGWVLCRRAATAGRGGRRSGSMAGWLRPVFMDNAAHMVFFTFIYGRRRFPRKFAPFPAWPVRLSEKGYVCGMIEKKTPIRMICVLSEG